MEHEPTEHAQRFWKSMKPLVDEIRLMSMTDLLWLRERLRDALGDTGEGSAGVREPRRPYPRSGGAGVALAEDDFQDEDGER